MSRAERLAQAALLAACLLVSLAASWTSLGHQFDNDVYDFLFRLMPAPTGEASAVVLGIDEQTLRSREYRGIRSIRSILASGLHRVAEAGATAVVVDLILADPGDEAEDAALAKAMARVPNLVLASDFTAAGGWEDPLPPFRERAAAVGHVHADPDPMDNVFRALALEKISHGRRFWALALEAWRITQRAEITEEPEALDLGGVRLRSARAQSRPMLVRYRPASSPIEQVSFHQLSTDPAAAAKLKGKAVFVGITAQSAARDRHMTPVSFGQTMAGVEIHAHAYDTLVTRSFPRPAFHTVELFACIALAAAAGWIFGRFSGAAAYAMAAGVLAAAHVAPWAALRAGVVLPYAPLLSAAWLSIVAAASFQHFYVRRKLERTEEQKDRYQKAIHFVVHEMRTPLTAIQGQSELMGRYKLSDEKRAEMAKTINNESKRLARMVQTFLDVERLTEGQMELKRETFAVEDLVDGCMERARPLAGRKGIRLHRGEVPPAELTGDRELMEYAVYNLINNAIKYSPSDTDVHVDARSEGGRLRLSVRDQGIGMDEQEQRDIFRKFYRTKSAEASGEAGTGIGLSIVEQIVERHGGKMEVASAKGKGSCFTVVLPLRR